MCQALLGASMAFGLQEWGFVIVIVLLLFGAAAIPKLARSLGRAQGEFKKARREMDLEMAAAAGETAETPASEESVRRTARELGIPEQGRDLGEVKRLIQQKLA